jgi:hypothetical protein
MHWFFFHVITIHPTYSLHFWLHQYSLCYLQKKYWSRNNLWCLAWSLTKMDETKANILRQAERCLNALGFCAWSLHCADGKWCYRVCVIHHQCLLKYRFWTLPAWISVAPEKPLVKKWELSWAWVAHVHNPSYSGGREQEDHSSKPALGNSSPDPISKKTITKKGLLEWLKV